MYTKKSNNWNVVNCVTILVVIIVKIFFSKFVDLSKFGYTSSILAVNIVKVIFISSFFFCCLLLNHSISNQQPKNSTTLTAFKLILSIQQTGVIHVVVDACDGLLSEIGTEDGFELLLNVHDKVTAATSTVLRSAGERLTAHKKLRVGHMEGKDGTRSKIENKKIVNCVHYNRIVIIVIVIFVTWFSLLMAFIES